jgi:subtilisin family serine protease
MSSPDRKHTKTGCGKPRYGMISFPLILCLIFIGFSPAFPPFKAEAQEVGKAADADELAVAAPPLSYMPGEVLVKFTGEEAAGRIVGFLEHSGIAGVVEEVLREGEELLALLELRKGVTVESAVSLLGSLAGVLYAEPNYVARASYAPTDPDYRPEQWGLNNFGQNIKGEVGLADADISAQKAWEIEKGFSDAVTVAVIDSGIDATHPDLDGKIWANSGEVPGNGIDDDGSGYADDVSGYNWAGITQSRFYYYNYTEGAYYVTRRYFGYNGLGTPTNLRAQSIVGTGQTLTHVGVWLQKVNLPGGDITVSIRETLEGADLASYTITPSEVTTLDYGSEIYRELSSPVDLVSGNTYYLVVETSTDSPTDYYYLYDNWGEDDPLDTDSTDQYDPYRDGQEYRWDDTEWLYLDYLYDDLYFRTNPNANPRDDNGHGTHVAGIVGAEEGNGQGGVGVSFGAGLMPLKVMDCTGSGYNDDITAAIYYAADNGAEVINMSLGGIYSSQAMQDAVDYAHDAGVIVLAASGNSGDSTMQYPAGYDNVIGVGATTNTDVVAGFSTHNASVDLSAPGVYIYSTMPTYAVGLNSRGYEQSYDYLSGTSMATPMAAGLAALVRSAEPRYDPGQVEQWMEQFADDLGASGRDDYFGYGRINAYKTLAGMYRFPEISGIVPDSGPAGTPVIIQGSAFGSTQGSSYVSFGGIQADAYTSWSDTRIVCDVSSGVAGEVEVTVTTPMGTSGGVPFTVTAPADTWYLAEGSTQGGMDTFILVQNPGDQAAEVTLSFMTGEGPKPGPTEVLPPHTRRTFKANDYALSHDVSTLVTSNRPVVAERSMYGNNYTWAHGSIGYTP